MKTSAAIGLFITLLCAVIAYQYHSHNNLLERHAKTQQTANNRKAALDALQANLADKIVAHEQLAQQQHRLQTQLSKRQQQIRRLQRENDHYRHWATTDLPAAVKRLRQRPAISGADQYQQWLSHTQTLLPASDSARQKRPPAQRSGTD